MIRLNRSRDEMPENDPHRRNPLGRGPGPGTPDGEWMRTLIAKGLMVSGLLYAAIITLHFEEPASFLAWLPVHALILSALLIAGIVVGFWDHRLDTTHASLGALFALVSGFAALAICQGML